MRTADGRHLSWEDYFYKEVGYNIRNREYLKNHTGIKSYVRDLIREVDRHPTELLKEVKDELMKDNKYKGDLTYTVINEEELAYVTR